MAICFSLHLSHFFWFFKNWTLFNCCSLFHLLLSLPICLFFLTIMRTLQRKGKAWQKQQANDEEVLLHCPSPLFSPIKHSHPFFLSLDDVKQLQHYKCIAPIFSPFPHLLFHQNVSYMFVMNSSQVATTTSYDM